MNCQNAIEQWS